MSSTLKKFPYKAIYIVGIANLAIWFAGGLHPNDWEILGLPLSLYLLISAVYNLAAVTTKEKAADDGKYKVALRRCMLCIIVLCLTIPAARLGHFFKTQIFLMKLPRYQAFVDQSVEIEKSHFPIAFEQIQIPKDYSDLFPYWVDLSCDKNHIITVEFLTDDYGFPARHGGYLYISNDNPSYLKGIIQYSDLGFFRVAPNWYYWHD